MQALIFSSNTPKPSAKAIGFRLRGLLLSHISNMLLLLQEPQAESIHAARRQLKKIRALLRLLRRALGKKVFKKEDSHFRDIHHGLSGLREEQVQQDLRRRFAVPLASTTEVNPLIFSMITRRLEHGYKRLQRYPAWEFSELQLWQGVEKLYRKGQESYAACVQGDYQELGAESENLHAWRKQVKYLENALEIMEPYVGNQHNFLMIFNQLSQLADTLGDIHDLMLFSQHYPEKQPACAEAQAPLLTLAFAAGQALYQMQSEAFVCQLQQPASEKS